jgi:hypothetical protein
MGAAAGEGAGCDAAGDEGERARTADEDRRQPPQPPRGVVAGANAGAIHAAIGARADERPVRRPM